MGANWATFSSLQPQLTAGPAKDQRGITSQGTWVLRGVTQVWTASAQGGIIRCSVQLCRLETATGQRPSPAYYTVLHQSRIFIGRTDAEVEAPILWSPGVKNWLIWKDPDAGKDWRQEEKENKMVGWYHWLSGHEFGQTLGDSEGQGSLASCSPWGLKDLDMTERMNK